MKRIWGGQSAPLSLLVREWTRNDRSAYYLDAAAAPDDDANSVDGRHGISTGGPSQTSHADVAVELDDVPPLPGCMFGQL